MNQHDLVTVFDWIGTIFTLLFVAVMLRVLWKVLFRRRPHKRDSYDPNYQHTYYRRTHGRK